MDVRPAVRLGTGFSTIEGDADGRVPRWRDVVAFAQRAEELGFDSFGVPDHLLFRGDGIPTGGVWDCWSLLAALAASTSRIALQPHVACTGFRNPALLAKMADTVDEISDGRLVLGLGAGWNDAEYRAFGFPTDHKVSRFAEALEIITRLLREGHVDFAGRYHEARDCELRPRGPRAAGPPILVGGTGPRVLGLTARYADRWNAWMTETGNTAEGTVPLLAALDAACDRSGRERASLERTVNVEVRTLPRRGSIFPPPSYALVDGSPAAFAEALDAYAELGVAEVGIVVRPCSLEGLEALAPALDAFRARPRG